MSRSRWVTERLAVALAAGAATGCARDEPAQPIRDIALSALPPEASETLALIRAGGPFPYARDGTTFFNREGLLPKERRGYYREYTVKTPGSPDRGARRIVAGRRGELYYTHDHYRSFRRIRQ
jgi:ribonuclease T1